MNMTTLLVLADDLTGANDTSVSFADSGFSTVLLRDAQALTQIADDVDVYALSADSRAAGEEAELTTREILTTAMEAGVTGVYVKIDSTMRGSVSYQIAGALAAWNTRHDRPVALVCPAYPAMGRTIQEGELRVHDVPVVDTPSGRDAIAPVKSSKMTELIPGAVHVPAHLPPEEVFAMVEKDSSRIFVFDASNQSDLETIADVSNRLGERAILVGSAGLAIACQTEIVRPTTVEPPVHLPLSLPPLVMVTSIHETSQEQVDHYISSDSGHGVTVFSPHPAQLRRDDALPHLLCQLRGLVSVSTGPLIIRANPARLVDGDRREHLARDFARKLAVLGAEALNHGSFGSVVLVGGDGAGQLIKALDINRSRILSSVVEGVPLSVAQDGAMPGLPLITKSGGFGEPDLLNDLIARIWKEEK